MTSHSHFRLKLVVIALTVLYSSLSFSKSEDVVVNPITPGSLPTLSAADNSSNFSFFPLYPRLDLTGGVGNNNFARADVMAPLFGSTSAIFYTDLNGQRGKGKSQYVGLGFGGRYAVTNNFMWGAYLFGDKSKSNVVAGAAKWTDINPGIEFMTNNWDGRINAYIPSGGRTNVASFIYGDGTPGVVAAEIGPGGDIDVGYTFTSLHRWRIHLGGYYYNLDTLDDIDGLEAGTELPVNNYVTFQFDDRYDEVVRNTAVVSVRFTLGGVDKFSNVPTVQDRLLDPIYRNLGALHTNAAIPDSFVRFSLS